MTRAEPSSHPAAGFSLPELLVSVMLLLSAMSTVTMLLGHMATSHRTVWNRTEMHSAVRGATELLQQEVGQAGLVALPGVVTLTAAVNTGVQTVGVTSAAGMFVGERLAIDAGSSQETVTLTAVNVAGNQITASFTDTHASGAAVAAVGGFASGIVPSTTANGSTGAVLKLFGDVNGDGNMVYVEYTCDTNNHRLYRNVMPWNAAAKPALGTAVNQPATNGDPTIQPGICSYTAGGRYTGALGTIDLRVVGSPSMPWLDPPGRLAPELPARRAWVQAQFNAVDRSMYLQMFHYIAPGEGGGPQQTLTALDGQVTVVPPVGLDETAASGNNPARFDAQGNLQPGSNQQTSQYMTWSGAAAAYQEDSRAGR